MSNKSKATHTGTCQICGATQKLPGGKLSTHGYTVCWGFFSGVCTGSHGLPFERSCDLIEAAIARATVQLKDLREFQAALRIPATKPKAFVGQYIPARQRGEKSYTAYYEAVILEEVVQCKSGDGSHSTFSYFQQRGRDEGKRANLQTYGDKGLLDVCSKLNAHHADRQETTAKQLEGYISWQQKRIQDWKPQPLTKVK